MDWFNPNNLTRRVIDTAATVINNRMTNSTSSNNVSSSSGITSNVIEINTRSAIEDVSRYPIKSRERCLILHGEIEPLAFTILKTWKYNIILHVPLSEKMFSIFRTDDKSEAEQIFGLFKRTIPDIVSCDPSVCVKDKLEKICNMLKENQGWSSVHVVAALDYSHLFRNTLFLTNLNDQENVFLRTPLHIAIIHKNVNAVNILIDQNVQVDVKDIKDNTVLHFAAQYSPQILQILFTRFPEEMLLMIDVFNKDGQTSLHVATINESVLLLLKNGANANLESKIDGSYPIHQAVKIRSLTSIRELVALNSNHLTLQDKATGGTPLHWANNWEAVELLLELGSDPNIPNTEGNVPLHVCVDRGCLKSTLMLLSKKAFTNMKGSDGNTPLHRACLHGHKSIIQVLIVFGADCNIKNDEGYTPRHLVCSSQRIDKEVILFYLTSIGAKRCPESIKNQCKDGCVYLRNKQLGFEGIPPEKFPTLENVNLVTESLNAFGRDISALKQKEVKSTSNGINDVEMDEADGKIGGRLLCLDGGGIRGLVLIQMLFVLEEEIGVPIVELFDWIAGTSTGGILALGLASGKSILELQGLYLRLKDKAFVGERPYSSDNFEEFLKSEFGSDRKMSSIRRPRVMISTIVADCRPVAFHFFRNYICPHSIIGQPNINEKPDDIYIWEAAKYTGAAPSYFRLGGSGSGGSAKYIDGGLIGNNPTLDALTELQHFNASLKSIGSTNSPQIPTVVVSLGTGIQPNITCNSSNLDIAWPTNFFEALSKANKLYSLVNLLIDQATQSEGQVVERSRAWCSSIGVPFFRFSPQMTKHIELDEKSDEVLVDLMWQTRVHILSQKDEILQLKYLLLQK